MTLVIVNYSNHPEVIKQYGSPTFYLEQYLFINGDNNAYKELDAIATNLLGFSSVQTTMHTKGEIKNYNISYSIKFLGNDIISSFAHGNDDYNYMVEKSILDVNQR